MHADAAPCRSLRGGEEKCVFDLAGFGLRDMIDCGKAVREVSTNAVNMEEAAQAIVSMFHDRLVEGRSGERNCALVRCFKTHRFGSLPEELRMVAQAAVPHGEVVSANTAVLTLLATAGDEAGWNDRRASRRHAAVPLESVEFVERAPMIAALLQQMGLGIEPALYPSAEMILDAERRTFNVFYVPDAVGDLRIPAQDSFVKPYGIMSVLGFGGILPSGDLFAVIMFSRTRVPRETADLFRTIALNVKLALLPFTRRTIYAGADAFYAGLGAIEAAERELQRDGPFGQTVEEQIRSEAATLRLLITALEEAALYQTDRLQTAFANLQAQGEHSRQQGVRLSAMLEATSDAVFLLDQDWKFTFLNQRAVNLFSAGRSLLGENVWEAFPQAVGTAFWENYHRAMNEGVSADFQEYYPEPLDKWFEVHAFRTEDGVAVFFRDISDRLKSEAALRQTEKLAATGRLAASIAHEINNPLEAVTNLLYLLGVDETLGDDSKGYVRDAESELRRVSEITTHMLRFYRQSTSPTAVDLSEVLESVLVLFQGRLLRADVTVKKRFETTKRLEGFAGELRQVFANLVGNALDATRDGGRLVLKIRDAWSARTGRRGIRVTVADTGSGMSAAVQKKLFEPFFTTKGVTGTGLGLWVSLELIGKHGGTVRVRSSDGKRVHGTVFCLFFPVG